MNKIERFIIEKIIKKEVVQGFNHKENIENLYLMINVACRKEFVEDNKPTLDIFLRECFDSSFVREIVSKKNKTARNIISNLYRRKRSLERGVSNISINSTEEYDVILLSKMLEVNTVSNLISESIKILNEEDI